MAKNKFYKSFKRKLVKALRSGGYKQGKEQLKYYPDGETPNYCCLGVACEVLKLSEEEFAYKSMPAQEIISKFGDFDYRENAYPETKEELEEADPINKLAYFNDHGKSFNWIAGYIERYL